MLARSREEPNETQRPEPDRGEDIGVVKGQTTGHVRIDIGNGVVITSSITNEAIDELALKWARTRWP